MKPTTLDELLEHLPGLRKLRSLNAELLRTMLDRQRGECTWCGAKVPKGCRMWCGDQCVSAFRLRCDPGYAAGYIAKRDNRICRLCGVDCAAKRIHFEIDHVIPVCEGGGLSTEDNLRLLCQMCHARQTAMLAARRSGKKNPPIPQWIAHDCSLQGCDGFQHFVKRIGRKQFAITCQVCGKREIVGQGVIDAAVERKARL